LLVHPRPSREIALEEFRAPRRSRESLLLQEANHRFANHLSLLICLLDQEAARTPFGQVRKRIVGQVAAFALVHRLLAPGGAPRLVEVGPYLTELCGYLSKAHLNGRGIRCRVDAVRGVLPAEWCRNLGLIVNELVTNAAKHAFPNRSFGLVTVVLRRRDTVWTVAVVDNGVGLDRPNHLQVGGGRDLMRALAAGLGARCRCRSIPTGTVVALRFRVDPGTGQWSGPQK